MSVNIQSMNPFEKSKGSMPLSVSDQVTTESSNEVLGMVAYTDGSCKPTNPGFIGHGVHGYTYKQVAAGEQPMALDHYITDQGYLRKDQLHFKFNNQKTLPVQSLEYFDFLGSSLDRGTNNQAEILAVLEALKFARERNIKIVTIRADSQYTRQGLVQWCQGWERNNWMTREGEPVKNQEHWKQAYGLYKQMREEGFDIQVHWIEGHDGNMGNVQADILAGIASNYSVNGVLRETKNFEPAKKYWKTEIERNPMMSFKRVYFNSSEQSNVPGCYFQADTGAADHLIAKRIPETGLSILKLNEPEWIIEELKQRQYQVSGGVNNIIMMKLDRVYDSRIYPYLAVHGRNALTKGKGNMNLVWFDKKPVNIEVGTTGLSMRAIDCFNLLEELLERFIKIKEANFPVDVSGNPVNVHDITNVFYDYTEVKAIQKCTLKPTFVVGFQDMMLDVEEPFDGASQKLKIPLILGTDLLPRNNLKKLESFNPHVYLLTWRESQRSLRYATVITSDKGMGIWSNFFADRIFFK